MSRVCRSVQLVPLFIGLIFAGFDLPGYGQDAGKSGAKTAALKMIHLPVRVHRLTSDQQKGLNCSLTDAEIREQFEAVNETWAAAGITWKIESIVDSEAQAPQRFAEAMLSPRGRMAAALASNLDRRNLLKSGFNVAIAEDFGMSIGGVFLPDQQGIVFYAKRGPKGIQTPAVLAHELGHALGLPHTIFEKNNNLMMGSGPGRIPTRVKPITASQIEIARIQAGQGRPFERVNVSAPKGTPAQIFASLDKDSDGAFDLQEVLPELRDFAREFLRKASRGPSDSMTRDQFLFVMERQQSAPRGGYGPQIVPQIFARFDRNRDRILTRTEANNPASLVHEYFDVWDADGNGQLTPDEISSSLKEKPAVPGALRKQPRSRDSVPNDGTNDRS